MGYLTHVDGRCYICEAHTDIFCDNCRRYICPEHRIERGKKFVFCERCEKEKRPPLYPKRTISNPQFAEGFTESKGF